MLDPVQSILRLSYYYSRFLGVINFEIDMGTGLARITKQASLYAALVNGLSFGMLILLSRSELIQTLWMHVDRLHEYLFLVVHGTRVTCVMATMFSRWWQRRHLIQLVNAFRRLAHRKPQVMRMWRRGVIIKFASISLSELLQISVSFVAMQPYLTVKLGCSVLMLYTLTVLVNVIVSHYYFALLNVHSHYTLLNQELHVVLTEILSLKDQHRKAAHMIKCCSLADRLEYIAATQSELQTLLERITHIFGIQGICVASNSYLSTIASIYFTFVAITQNPGVKWTPLYIVLFVLNISCYFADIIITANNIYLALDVHADMVRLLERIIMLSPGLDQRLQMVIESFQLQLTRKPLKISVLKLYNVDRTKFIAMTSSLVTNSLVLIQYAMKYAQD